MELLARNFSNFTLKCIDKVVRVHKVELCDIGHMQLWMFVFKMVCFYTMSKKGLTLRDS